MRSSPATCSQPHVTALLIGGFAAMAMLLAAVGLYAVIAAGVASRTRGIGVRMALGAAGRDVVRLVVRRGMWLTVLGLAIGTLATLALGRVFGSLLYGITAADPQTHVVTVLVLAVVALLATCIPAWRAVRVDPMIALRSE